MIKLKVYPQQVQFEYNNSAMINMIISTSKLSAEEFKLLMFPSSIDDYDFELLIKRKYNKKK